MTDADADRPDLTGAAAEVYDLIAHKEPVHSDTIFEEIPSYPRDEMSRSLEDLKRDGLVEEVEEPIPELDGATRTLVATEGYVPQFDEETGDSVEAEQSPEQEDDEVVHQAEVTDQSLAVVRRALRDQQHKAATSEEYDALETALDELPEETLAGSEEFAKKVLP